MAIKDQCINCKSFNGNVCLLTNVAPYYNQTSCERYTKRGIILDKGNSSSPITPQPTNNVATEPIFVKQGMFSQPFSFSGRIRRLEYFISGILAYIYALMIGFFVGASGGGEIRDGISLFLFMGCGCYSVMEMNLRMNMVPTRKGEILTVNHPYEHLRHSQWSKVWTIHRADVTVVC